MNHFEFNGRVYAFDLEKMMEFISNNPESEKLSTSVVTKNTISNDSEETWSCQSTNDTMSSYRYNLMETFVNNIIAPMIDSDGYLIGDINKLSVGQKLIYNTLYEMGIIYEIDIEE